MVFSYHPSHGPRNLIQFQGGLSFPQFNALYDYEEKCEAALVGAGLAGLMAARELKRGGFSVRLLEARDGVGGRVWSQRLGDSAWIDFGAQWIAPGQRRIQALVKEFGLATAQSHSMGTALRIESGDPVPSRGFSPSTWLAKLDELQILLRRERQARQLAVPSAQTEARRQALDALPVATWLEAKAWTQEGRDAVGLTVEEGVCASVQEVSCYEVIQQLANIGGLAALARAEHTFLPGGAMAIARRLASGLSAELELATPVLAVHQEAGAVRLTTRQGQLRARRVILALPPQLLASIALDAELARRAQWYRGAIVKGRVVKTVIVYGEAWWRRAGLSGQVVDPEGLIEHLADGSNPAGSPGILIAFATASRAERLAALEPGPRQALILEHIRQSLGEVPAAPLAFHSIDWMEDPWAQGGYASRLGLGCQEAQQPVLAEPIGRVHFAGTETASQWRSYMEGALESGERAALEVLSCLALP
jgi:monoamine oxidase